MANKAESLVDPRQLKEFQEDSQKVQKALALANQLAEKAPFKTREEASQAADAIRALSLVHGEAEERKLGITGEWRASTTAVNNHYKELLSPVKAAEQALKRAAINFKKAEEVKVEEARKQAEREQAKEAEEKLKEALEAEELAKAEPEDAELKQLADETRQDAAAAAAAPPTNTFDPPKQVRGSFGALATKTIYRIKVVDAAQVPDPFKAPSMDLLNAAVAAEKNAAKEAKRDFSLTIPGCEIESEEVGISH